MADDLNKNITITVTADTDNLNDNITSLSKAIDGLLAQQKQLDTAGQQNSATYDSITAKIDALQKKLHDATTQLNTQAAALGKLATAAKTSDSALGSLNTQLKQTAKAAGDSLAKTKDLSSQLNSLGQSTKQQKGNIDAAAASISKHASSTAKSASGTKKLQSSIDKAGTALQGQVSKTNQSKTAFDLHKQTMDHLKKSFNEVKNVSGEFGPSLQEAAQGFNAMKTGLSIVQGGLKGVGDAIKADGFDFLLQILQYLFDAFKNSAQGGKILQGAISAIGVVVNEVKGFFKLFLGGIIDAVSHPIDSIKSLGNMIEQNIINRFKAFSVILDGIIHLDFKKITDGAVQAFTGVTDATDKIGTAFTKVQKGVEDTANNMVTAFNNGYTKAGTAIDNNESYLTQSVDRQIAKYNELGDTIKKTYKRKHKDKPSERSNIQLESGSRPKNDFTVANPDQGIPPTFNNPEQSSTATGPSDNATTQSEDDAKKSFEIIAADAISTLQSSLKQQADAKVAALEKDRTAELNNASLTTAQKLAINAKYNKQEGAVKAKAQKQEQVLGLLSSVITSAQEITSTQQTADKVVNIKKTALLQIEDDAKKSAAKIAADAISAAENSIKQQASDKVAALEQDKATELNNTSLTSAQKLAINAKYKNQEDQVKAKAFKDDQKLSIAQAVINGALAITKVSAQTGVLAALSIGVVVAETAAEVAKISSQKPPAYASGGLHYSSDGRGGVLPGYSKTDNTNAYLRSGEGVVVSEAMRDPWARNLVSAINVGFGGRDFSTSTTGRAFAVGGVFTDGGDANRYYNQPVNDNKNLANSIAYQMVNNFPPVYVDVKDINNQQNILAQTINRVNL